MSSKLDPPPIYPPLFAAEDGSLSPSPRAVDINVGWVIEQPRDTSSALASLLNLSRRAPQPLPVALSVLPEVTRKDFDPYVSLLRAGRLRSGRVSDEFSSDAPPLQNKGHTVRSLLSESRGAGTSAAVTSSPLRASSAADAFDSVPGLYFRSDFDLKERGVLAGIVAADSLETTQAALTAHLDGVECQLLGLIRSRAPQFFVALRDLQELQNIVTAANKTSQQLQVRVAQIKQECIIQPLYIVAASRRRQHQSQAATVMRNLREASLSVAEVAQQVSMHLYDKALRCISRSRGRIRRYLGGVRAAAALAEQLNAYERLIGDTLVGNYASAALSYALAGVPSSVVCFSESTSGIGTPFTTTTAPASIGLEAFLTGAFSAESANSGPVQRPLSLDACFTEHVFSAGPQPFTVGDDASLVSEVLPLLTSLLRSRRLDGAMEVFQARFISGLRDSFDSEVSEAIRAVLEDASGAGSTTDGGHAMAMALESLGSDAFIAVTSSVSRSCIDTLRRVHALHDMVERLLDSNEEAAAMGSTADTDVVSHDALARRGFASSISATAKENEDGYFDVSTRSELQIAAETSSLRALSSGVIAVCVEAMQSELVRLLALRRDASVHMRTKQLRQLWDVCATFTSKAHALLAYQSEAQSSLQRITAEGISASSVAPQSPLLEECTAHAQAALRHLHERNLSALAALLDAEQWTQADVPMQVQFLADAIIASTGLRALGKVAGSSVVLAAAAAADVNLTILRNEDTPNSSGMHGVDPLLFIRGRSFHVVGAGVMLIKMLGDYSGLGESIPQVAAKVISATVQLLREFNVRTTRLVLNAGALKSSAALKRITAKHLALTLQTIGAVLALLPSIRGALVMRLPSGEGALLEELSRVTSDFMQHEQRLLGQFVAIAKDLLTKVCGDMANLPWAVCGTPMTVPTPPMREFVKGIAALHKILAAVLPHDQLSDVFAGVDAMVAVHVPLQYASVISRSVETALIAPPTSARFQQPGMPLPPSTISTTSRSVAAQRLAADLNVLCSSLRQLWTHDEGAGKEDRAGETCENSDAIGNVNTSSRGDCGGRVAGLASIVTLQAWVATQFEVGVTADVPAVNVPVSTPPKLVQIHQESVHDQIEESEVATFTHDLEINSGTADSLDSANHPPPFVASDSAELMVYDHPPTASMGALVDETLLEVADGDAFLQHETCDVDIVPQVLLEGSP